jgi:hypothetical protein
MKKPKIDENYIEAPPSDGKKASSESWEDVQNLVKFEDEPDKQQAIAESFGDFENVEVPKEDSKKTEEEPMEDGFGAFGNFDEV